MNLILVIDYPSGGLGAILLFILILALVGRV
jgi:hypothetical protein